MIDVPGGEPASGGDLNPPLAGDAPSPIVAAISQQSMALTQLVAHLAGGDPIGELSSSSSQSTGLNTKGVARRERMQTELAGRTSSFFMQMQQQLHKKMMPSRPIPQTEAELSASNFSMTSYMERYGGYRNNKEMGMAMWIASHAVDAAAQDDFRATKEYLSLLVISMEQATLDGNWSVASILSLPESPPSLPGAGPISCHDGPPILAIGAAQLGRYGPSILERNRGSFQQKTEIKVTKPPKTDPKNDAETPTSPSPRRRPKFPKRPKGAPQDAPAQK